MVEGRSVELRISLRASEQALKLLSLSIFSSDQETFSYEHVQTSSMLMDKQYSHCVLFGNCNYYSTNYCIPCWDGI